jgi:hypothetical protein
MQNDGIQDREKIEAGLGQSGGIENSARGNTHSGFCGGGNQGHG